MKFLIGDINTHFTLKIMNTIQISAPTPVENTYLGLCTAGELDSGDGSCFDDTDHMTPRYEGFSSNNGDVSTSYTTFVLSTDENGINIGNVNEEPFLSLDVSESVFDVDDIRYVGVQSHDGTDGSSDHVSDWIFCINGNYYDCFTDSDTRFHKIISLTIHSVQRLF